MTTNVTVTGTTVTVTDNGDTVVVAAASSPAIGVAWGAITGTLASQTDLDSALAGKAPTAGLKLVSTANNYVSAPDTAGLSIVGDIDVRVHCALTDWTPPSAYNGLLCKRAGAGFRSWGLLVGGSINYGKVVFIWSVDGTNEITVASTVGHGLTDGSAKWVRATLDVDNGASGYDVKFYLSDDGTTWTQLGATVTGGATTSIFDSTAAVETRFAQTYEPNGVLYRAQIYSGIGGSLVGEWRGDIPATRYMDAAGNVWSVTGTANGWVVA